MKITKDSAQILAEKAKLVMNKEIFVANETGCHLVGKEKSSFSYAAQKAIATGELSYDEDQGVYWKGIVYEDQPIGALGLKSKKVNEETMNLISGMAEVIVYQQFLFENLYATTDIRSKFLNDLLVKEKYKTFDEALPEADILKINLRPKQCVYVIRVENLVENYLKKLNRYKEEEKKIKVLGYVQEIELSIKKAFNDMDQNVVVFMGDDKFLLLKGIEDRGTTTENSRRFFKAKASYLYDHLKKEMPESTITIGVGQYYPELEGLQKSYQDATIALDIGLKVWGQERIYHILEVGTFASLSGEISHKRKVEISEQVLGKLLNEVDLLKTVTSFLSSGMNLTVAAKELHLHRNTLIYRLNKVKNLIGLDPKKFSDALKIKLGLLVCQVK